MSKIKIRPLLVVWHRWFGLIAGLWLFLLAATGSVLVFYQEIDHALNPHLWSMQANGEPQSYSRLVAAAEAFKGGSYASFVDLPNRPDAPLVAYLSSRPDAESKIAPGTHVFVNPRSGQVAAERVFGAARFDRLHFAQLVYQLHRNLYLGTVGNLGLGLVAFLWLLDHGVAAALSFPSPRKWWQSFWIRRGVRGAGRIYGLHRAAGLWLLPVTAALALSGVYFNWYDLFVAAVDRVSPRTPSYAAAAQALEEPLFDPPVSLDQALVIAQEHVEGAEIDSVSISPFRAYYWFRVFDPLDLADYGGRWVVVDMRSAEVRWDHHPRKGTTGDLVIALQYPLHSGKVLGAWGRALIFISGLVVCALVVTGVWLWAKKRTARRRHCKGRRAQTTAQTT